MPQKLDKHPRLVLAIGGLILCGLIRVAHPHERYWDYAVHFLLGFGIALLIAEFVFLRKAKVSAIPVE